MDIKKLKVALISDGWSTGYAKEISDLWKDSDLPLEWAVAFYDDRPAAELHHAAGLSVAEACFVEKIEVPK